VLDVQSARAVVLRYCRKFEACSLPTEVVPLAESFRRVLAEPVVLDCDQPPFNRAMRDGYALRTEDLKSLPVELKCVTEIRAGDWPAFQIGEGEAAPIMTGAPVPDRANGIIMLEYTERVSDKRVRILKPVQPGENITLRGTERRRGESLAISGSLISVFEMGVLAAAGKSNVKVYSRPTVSILTTGDELTGVDQQPRPGQIRDTNSQLLLAQVLSSGAQPHNLESARDSVESLRTQIDQGLKHDVLVISGGVSVGKYDLVKRVLGDLGAQIHFSAVNMRPGKPTVFASLGQKSIYGLPGNPVSTFVTFELFVKPLLHCLQGLEPGPLPLVRGILNEDVSDKSGRTSFLPITVTSRDGLLEMSPVDWKGSADVFSLMKANGFVIVPETTTHLESGCQVEALLFSELHIS
jgi:molybdopterin molybdotransferase